MSRPDDGHGTSARAPRRLAILAPNWLGDAVMALPLVADLHRAWPETAIAVAARGAIADLFTMVPEVGEVLVLDGPRGLRDVRGTADAARLAAGGFDAVLVLPNSFRSAWVAFSAGIPERWGYATDLRSRLLTRRFRRPGAVHQADYYGALATALGVARGDAFARVVVTEGDRDRVRARLSAIGLADGRAFVACAPGAAYGRAKQWLPERFAELAVRTAEAHGAATVLVGARGDRSACQDVARRASRAGVHVIDLSGQTSLGELAALLSLSLAVVSNDSGAMHLAAAAGARLVAIFGPTDERRTSPLRAAPSSPAPVVLTADVWCRRCLLRECPIDHRCMSGVSAASALAAIDGR
jgi:heptosyltransferase-2